ncbi:MAG: hypothetical protein PVI78_00515 [Anaerolineales bacterium]|jgi:cytoskeletal protein RodZ
MAEDFEFDVPPVEDEQESPNRTFITAAAGIGGLLILSLICLGLYTLLIAPRQREAREQLPTEIALTNTEIARRLTETALAEIDTEAEDTATPTATSTPSPTEAVSTATPTASNTPEPTTDPLIVTAQAAQQAATATSTPTALPGTGFADDIGIQGMLLLAAALVVVIFVARHLRTRSA